MVFKYNINGCGPGKLARFIPNFIFFRCCNCHDANYAITTNDRWVADKYFLVSMMNEIERHGSNRNFYTFVALFYFLTVRLLGGFFRE